MFEGKSKEVQKELFERHAEDKENYEKHIRKNLFLQPRMTPEVLNAEYQIAALIKAQKYSDANRLQMKANKLVDGSLPVEGRDILESQKPSYVQNQ